MSDAGQSWSTPEQKNLPTNDLDVRGDEKGEQLRLSVHQMEDLSEENGIQWYLNRAKGYVRGLYQVDAAGGHVGQGKATYWHYK